MCGGGGGGVECFNGMVGLGISVDWVSLSYIWIFSGLRSLGCFSGLDGLGYVDFVVWGASVG